MMPAEQKGQALFPAPPRTTDPVATAPASAAVPSTVLQLTQADSASVVYARPPAALEPVPAFARSWATEPRDTLSALMQRNTTAGTDSLAARWRGLGGALLTRLAQQPGDYRQTLVLHADGVAATDALVSARDRAVTAQLRVQTRSGAQVELSIAVNRGAHQVLGGLQVEMRSTGALTDAERQALGALASGLDQALQGLGQADAPRLDLAGLLAYDKRQLARLELTVRSPDAADPLAALSLQANARETSIRLQGSAGNLALRLDTATPLGQAGPARWQPPCRRDPRPGHAHDHGDDRARQVAERRGRQHRGAAAHLQQAAEPPGGGNAADTGAPAPHREPARRANSTAVDRGAFAAAHRDQCLAVLPPYFLALSNSSR